MKVGVAMAAESVWPELVTVKVTGAEVWVTVVAANVLPGLGVIASEAVVSPLPCSVAVAVPPGVAVVAIDADSAIVVDGVKTTLMVHVCPAGSAAVQLFVTTLKSAGIGPRHGGVSPGRPDGNAPPVFWTVSVTGDELASPG